MWGSFQGRKCLVDIYRDIPRSLGKIFGAFKDFSKLDNEGLSMTVSKVERRGLKDHALNANHAFCRIVENLTSHQTISVPGRTNKRRCDDVTGLSELMGSA